MNLRLRTSPGSGNGHLYWRTPNTSGDVPEEINEVAKGVKTMGRVSGHLKKFHEHASEHHSMLHKCFSKLAGGMEKAAKKDGVENAEDLTDCLKTIASTHEAAANFHKEMASACTKAEAAADLEKSQLEPLPDGLSRVAPEQRTSTVRMVPRTGQVLPVAKTVGKIGGIDFLALEEMDNI
jgi:hypothetical protein